MGNRNYCQELCSSFILTLFPHFPCASPVWGCSSSWTVPACVPAARCSPSLTACSRVVFLQSHKSWQQTCCSMDSSLHRVTGAAGSLFQKGLSMESLPPSDTLLLWFEALHGLQDGSQLHHESPWVVGESSLWHLEHLFPLLLHWPLCLQGSFSFISCSSLLAAVVQGFFSLLNYVIPEVLLPLLMNWALPSSSSVLELVGSGFLGHRGSFWHLMETTPVGLYYYNLSLKSSTSRNFRSPKSTR